MRAPRTGLLALAALALAGCSQEASTPLPELRLDPARVAVAGLSSGAYMATQTHLAWPELFSGAALAAGGPWGCAGGELARALSSCMKDGAAIDVTALVQRAREYAQQGRIGPLSALAGDRVHVLHGTLDETVDAAVSEAAVRFYQDLPQAADGQGVEVTWDGARAFAHNLPVAGKGEDCGLSQPPYLGHCGYDAAGAMLATLYGPPPRTATEAKGQLQTFDQHALDPGGRDAYLDDDGYLYVPPACQSGQTCGLLVVFHGCQQNAAAVGTAFVGGAGFNRWADVYDLVVLYPQARASFAPLNPKACWDWWGYSGANYDSRDGLQQQWLRAALTQLGLPAPQA